MIQKALILFPLLLLSACELSNFENADISYSDITIYWSAPTQRVNGDKISLNDIAGYEIRYREKNDQDFTYVLIADGRQDQILLEGITKQGNYTFEVAAIDNYGIYSRYALAAR